MADEKRPTEQDNVVAALGGGQTMRRRKGSRRRGKQDAGWSPATVADVYVCNVSDELKANLGVVTSASRFRLESQGRHIREQRGGQALLLINSLKHIVEHAEYIEVREPGRVYAVVGPTQDGSDALVAIKFVAAAFADSKVDEAWIRTSRPVKEKEIRGKTRQGIFQPVSGP